MKIKRKSHYRVLFTILFFIALMWSGVVTQTIQAQTELNLSVSPPLTYMSIKPGEEKTYQITLENLGSNTIEVTPNLVDFESNHSTGHPVLQKNSSFKHLRINDGLTTFGQKFVLKPKQKTKINISINIPQNEPEGEFPMTLLFNFENQNEYQATTSKTEVSGIIGSNLIVFISHNNLDRGELIIPKISALPIIDSLMPLNFSLSAQNIGKNATPINGHITILDMRNHEVAKFDFHPDMVLAGNSRQIREKESLSPDFKYKPPFLFGIYKIKAEIAPNQTTTETNAINKTVLAFPFSIILLPIIGTLMYLIYRGVLKNEKT